jgi:eukaryotic-like serine/threonine-protein kinase
MTDNKAYVDIISGPFEGQRFYFHEQDTFMVGRAGDCAISIREDKTMSRHHMLLEINQGNVLLRDLGSLNGTRVNDKLIRLTPGENRDLILPPEALRDGDRIVVGGTSMVFHSDYPMFCSECGTEIPLSDLDTCQFVKGAYICVRCRKTEADVEAPEEEKKPEIRKAIKLNREHYDQVEENPGKVLEELLSDYLKKQESRGIAPQICGYKDLTVLGEGGYGLVYKATRIRDDQIVAVKTMLQTRKPDKRKLQLFEREKEIVSQLDHPNIVRSQSVGVWNDIHFIEMDYIAGGSLWKLMEQGKRKVNINTAAPLILEMLEGLAYAHEVEVTITTDEGKKKLKGIVHRDIKPSNVLLDNTGGIISAKISDFGLAKAFGAAGCTQGVLSRTGTTCGSPVYMAPEHLTNYKYVKATTDVFEMAATIFFMLTGQPIRPLRKGQDPFRSVLEDQPRRLEEFLEDCPRGLDEVMNQALAYDEKDRFKDGGEFLAAMGNVF